MKFKYILILFLFIICCFISFFIGANHNEYKIKKTTHFENIKERDTIIDIRIPYEKTFLLTPELEGKIETKLVRVEVGLAKDGRLYIGVEHKDNAAYEVQTKAIIIEKIDSVGYIINNRDVS